MKIVGVKAHDDGLSNNFRVRVEQLMAQVPHGIVTTYGDLAALAGSAHAARIVGGIAHYGSSELPWHRLVNRFGGLAAAFPGGREAQQQLLEAEGLSCTDFIVNRFKEVRWQPKL
jgi:methylated-DNA-protein-cysteine methyltransferase-like protein